MNLRSLFVPVLALALLAYSYYAYGGLGAAAVGGGLLMWALLHFNRLMSVMRKAAQRPIGHVGSAVMLNARLRAGVNLMHVVALTRALGQPVAADGTPLPTRAGAQPAMGLAADAVEFFRWTDGSQSHVTCEFRDGRLVQWALVRPPEPESAP